MCILEPFLMYFVDACFRNRRVAKQCEGTKSRTDAILSMRCHAMVIDSNRLSDGIHSSHGRDASLQPAKPCVISPFVLKQPSYAIEVATSKQGIQHPALD